MRYGFQKLCCYAVRFYVWYHTVPSVESVYDQIKRDEYIFNKPGSFYTIIIYYH